MKSTTLMMIALFLSKAILAGDPMFKVTKVEKEFLVTNPELGFKKRAIAKDPFRLSESKLSDKGKDEIKKDMTSSFTFMNFGLFLPKGSFTSSGPGIGFGMDFGSFFKLGKSGQVGFGLRATWLAYDFGVIFGNILWGYEQTISNSVVKVGPQCTFGFNDKIAIDVFYQAGPNYTYYHLQKYNSDVNVFGITQELGACARIDRFSIGAGFQLENIWDNMPADNDRNYDAVNFKLNFGVRF